MFDKVKKAFGRLWARIAPAGKRSPGANIHRAWFRILLGAFIIAILGSLLHLYWYRSLVVLEGTTQTPPSRTILEMARLERVSEVYNTKQEKLDSLLREGPTRVDP